MRISKVILVVVFTLCATAILLGSGAVVSKVQGYISAEMWGAWGLVELSCTDVQSPSGVFNASCHGAILDENQLPEETEILTGFECDTPAGITTDTRATIAVGGEVNMTCKVHKDF